MKRNKKPALALALGLALLTLSGCDGTEGGTIDYIDGHWVFTSTQTEQQTDITQLLASPDAFYAAASALTDEELQRSFDRLSPSQCTQIFSTLGEERAMALAGRLTQTQVERLLTALQGQRDLPTEPSALAAIWQTLTTEEQLSALGSLSSADYAALWALLDGATPSPVPDAALPEATAAPDTTDPVYLAGIWHTLTQQEQSAALGGLSSAQFVALWSLLDAQGSAASGEIMPVPSDGWTDTQQTSASQTLEPSPEAPAETAQGSEGAPVQEPEASASPDAEQMPVSVPTDPAALAEVWFTLSPQEQMSAIAALTADQFVSLQELLSARPKPTPAEEDDLFIPTPRPTARRTPRPTPTPTAPPDETQVEPAEPDLTDPAVLADIWHTLSPQEQLSILSTLTIEQYTALQELLTQLSDSEGDVPNHEEPAVEEKPDKPNEGSGDGSTPEEESPDEKPNASDEADSDDLVSEDKTPAEQPDESDGTDGNASTSEEETPAEKPDEPDETDGDAATPEEETPAEKPDESDGTGSEAATPEEETPAEKPDESDETGSEAATPEEETPAGKPNESDRADGGAATSEEETPAEQIDESDGTDSDPSDPKEEDSEEGSEASAPIDLVYLASIWNTLSPSEQLSILSTLSTEQYHALQQLLVRRLNGGEDMPKNAEPDGENVPAEEKDEPDETNSDASVTNEEIPEENPDESVETTNDTSTPEEKASSEQSVVSDEAIIDLTGMEDGLVQTSDLLKQLLPGRMNQTDGEAVPSAELIPRTDSSQEPLDALSIILKNGNL